MLRHVACAAPNTFSKFLISIILVIQLEIIKQDLLPTASDTLRPIPSAREKKSVVATAPGHLSANLLECLCVSLAVLSSSVHQRIDRREEKEHIQPDLSLFFSLSCDGKGIKVRRR